MERIFPPKLQKGDEVRVIAPSKSLGVVGKEDVEQAIKVLQALGLKVTFGAHIYERDEHQTSSVESRLIDLHTAFSDKKVKLVLAAFGGFLFCLNTCSGFVEQAKGFEMEAIAGAVIGGTLLTGGVGNVIGSLFGVFNSQVHRPLTT